MNTAKSLRTAKSEKNDEFYTRYKDIENEVKFYKDQLAGKTILCNCDDPTWSNFWLYFHNNFNTLKLKKLISTHYEKDGASYAMIYDGIKDVKIPLIKQTPEDEIDLFNLCNTESDGDFRNPECIEYLKEADIVITNPPFSLFREFVMMLEQYNKKYLIIGNPNAVAYKELFPLIRENKMWLGYKGWTKQIYFELPEETKKDMLATKKVGSAYVIDDGEVLGRVPAVWFTNLDVGKRHLDLVLDKSYNEADYPMYDNYNVIEVSKVVDIPCDYYGIMGVPIPFLDKFNPEQFEIVGAAMGWTKTSLTDEYKELVGYNEDKVKSGYAYLNGEQVYHRIFIKRKK